MNFLLRVFTVLAAVSILFVTSINVFESNYINLQCVYRRQVASSSTGIHLFQIFFNLVKQIIEFVLGHSKILIKFHFVIS
jgi:hypothetical protein